MEKTTMDLPLTLRNKLSTKKNNLKFKKLSDVVQKMYDLMNKLKLWGELK